MTEALQPTPPAPDEATVSWPDPARRAAFEAWLQALQAPQGLRPDTLRPASADASFRRYLRLDTLDGKTRIVMDAPPQHEDCRPFVRVAALMAEAGLRVPEVLAWHEAQGFLLLSDLGPQTWMARLDAQRPDNHRAEFMQAVEVLLRWQQASRPGVLPPYDEALLRRELQLFPDWYLGQHKGLTLSLSQQEALQRSFDAIVARNLAAPSVYVHRDFMPRNLLPNPAAAPGDACQAMGVLDFQDAVHGPVTYDIASLMRDAFISWDEDMVIDVTVRYWERARRLGLMDFEDWHQDFGAFYRAVEWMGLQRHLKVAGIFARLSLRDGKPRYLEDTPRFIGYIRATAHRYRELGGLLRLIDEVEGLQAASGFAFGRV